MADSNMELIQRMRLLEADHAPDGWPAVQMRDISALCDELEASRAERDALLAEKATRNSKPALSARGPLPWYGDGE